MQYFWKVFLWENGTKSTEYTNGLAAPVFIEDRLDEQLDTGMITLEALPIATKGDFPPKTKFRIERYLQADYLDTPKTWDFIVDHDDVEEYAGSPDICCHRIHLIEVSAVAQGMHVDNIALTYELQDVDLNYRIPVDDETIIGDNIAIPSAVMPNSPSTLNLVHRITSAVPGTVTGIQTRESGWFANSYKYEWDSESFNSIRSLKAFRAAEGTHTITFDIPTLNIYGYRNNGWLLLFELNTTTTVKEETINGSGVVISSSVILTKDSGPDTLLPSTDNSLYAASTTSASIRRIKLTDDQNSAEYYPAFPDGTYAFPISQYREERTLATSENGAKTTSFTTTPLSASQAEEGFERRYTISFSPKAGVGGLITFNQQYHNFRVWRNGVLLPWQSEGTCDNLYVQRVPLEQMNSSVTPIRCLSVSEGASVPYVKKSVKYSCYQLIRKALLTCDTRVINHTTHSIDEYGLTPSSGSTLVPVPSINYPILLDENTTLGDYNLVDRLKATKINETVLEGKNLWEVLLQVGYYIHAIPYLEFYNNPLNNVDKLVLKFRQLGGTTRNLDTSTKITVFNSTNLSEYFAQYDSYATNLFSPQNICEEWVSCKTSDTSFLVSNETAEIQLSYAITELLEFDIIYNGVSKSAIEYVFEKAIYDTLTGFDPRQVSPAKGNSLYFVLGDNKITGLSYVAQSVNPGDTLMALKYILQKVHNVNPSVWTQTYTFNNLRFRVRYRTQDTARITQFRPDLTQYLKNSSLEVYPHHEQFYGQQDKIIDSERFTANLWGKLIRVGNNVIERQEYSPTGSEKETGEIVSIDNENYYVITTENEFYPDAVFQKVTYSKNFNQLANIVTIPSEPRFYEVSERSKIRREIRIQEFFKLSTKESTSIVKAKYMRSFQEGLYRLIFAKIKTLPNYAWTNFLADKFRKHEGATGGIIPTNQLFPSSDVTITVIEGQTKVFPDSPSDHKECIVPLLHFPLRNGIVFEWDMEDNFKVGDMIDNRLPETNTTADNAYLRQQALRYADLMGRADLFQFMLFNKSDWTTEQIQQLPKAVITPLTESTLAQVVESNAIVLDKDNREALSFNYQINILYDTLDNGDGFITYPNLFGDKENDLKVCLLNKEQSMFDDQLRGIVIADLVSYGLQISIYGDLTITFYMPTFIGGFTFDDVMSVAFYDDTPYGKIPYIVRNVAKQQNVDKLKKWAIAPVFNT